MSAGWDFQLGQHPLPPMNSMAFHALKHGSIDIRWDDPAILARNTSFNIVGVNIYKSEVSDRGPFTGPVNEFPLGGGFFRDHTQLEFIEKETIHWEGGWQAQGNAPNQRRFVLCSRFPIVKRDHFGPYDKPVYGNTPQDVQVFINDEQVMVHWVFGRDGTVELVNEPTFNVVTEKVEPGSCPTEDDVVQVSYWRLKNLVRNGLDHKTYYRVVTVAVDPSSPSGFIETPLDFTQPVTHHNVEQLDWVWKEAIRQNHWILQQGGERVKLFIKRTSGFPCDCRIDARQLEYNQQPLNSCQTCYGAGFIGGYEGPYDIIIVQDGAENRISQRAKGRKKEKTQDVWMTMTPLVTQRDFIVKLTGERFSIGGVTRHTARGIILQQHYSIGYLDQTDIVYYVPIDGTSDLLRPPQTRYAQTPAPLQPQDGDTGYQGQHHMPVEPPFPAGDEGRWPEVTDKDHSVIEEERQGRGRTPVWENITYAWPFVLYFLTEALHQGAGLWV